MDNLFSHSGFKLVFIDDKNRMSLKTPMTDEKAREDIINPKIGYRCISHLWGTVGDAKDHTWKKEDHKVDGVTWKVEVREEKRKRVMQIFEHHKGYFWMDVLCTDQEDENKPLDVMGDIYKKCRECICLLDTICDVPGFTSEKEVLKDIAKDLKEYMDDGMKISDKKYGEGSQSWQHPNSANISTKTGHELYLDSLLNGKWFNRVWTWQEAVLPPKLLFCSEQDKYTYDPYDQEFLRELFPYEDMGYDTDGKLGPVPPGDIFPGPLNSIRTITNIKTKQGDIWDSITLAAKSNRKCTNEEDFVYGIIGILGITIPNGLTLPEAMEELEKVLLKNGIFIGERTIQNYRTAPHTLANLYDKMRLIDGVTILGNVSPSIGSDLEVYHENHGMIWHKSKHEPNLDSKTYGHIRYRYATGTSFIYLKTGKYGFLDTLETTKIGRKGCSFGSNMRGHEPNEIFEIMGNRVKLVGYMVGRSYKDVKGHTYWKSIWS